MPISSDKIDEMIVEHGKIQEQIRELKDESKFIREYLHVASQINLLNETQLQWLKENSRYFNSGKVK